jgi:tryptophan-rich sensory protein
MKINKKSLIINILIPLVVGGVAALLTRDSMTLYANVQKPPFSPPSLVFPIVWTILYILMGISAYRVMEKGGCDSTFYSLQLFVNFLWPVFFFSFEAYLFAFVLLLVLIALVVGMIMAFYKCDKWAGYLQIPYLLWLLFAGYLNLGVYLLNR